MSESITSSSASISQFGLSASRFISSHAAGSEIAPSPAVQKLAVLKSELQSAALAGGPQQFRAQRVAEITSELDLAARQATSAGAGPSTVTVNPTPRADGQDSSAGGASGGAAATFGGYGADAEASAPTAETGLMVSIKV